MNILAQDLYSHRWHTFAVKDVAQCHMTRNKEHQLIWAIAFKRKRPTLFVNEAKGLTIRGAMLSD